MRFPTISSLASLALAASVPHVLADRVPDDLVLTRFSEADVTPCPACLACAPTGEVYVGVDLLGSLGKGPGQGKIVRLIDRDNDGMADEHTEYAKVDHPRGLQPLGDQLFVLHTVYDSKGLATGMDLSVFEDRDGDGVADGPAETLVSGICSGDSIRDRGTDHSTNGIRMGIDGWIYIAVGDFGFPEAKGTDGTTLNMLGGGIVRVRPDGTELEVYTHGTRNIYDVAIDPYMNIFTRGNTNDGGGWNVRFLHHLQSGEFGYPTLFKGFTDEIIPALVDVGGGSGVGSLYLQEPTWPDAYNNNPIMADWGRKQAYIHRITPDGPSFTQEVEDFIQVDQVSDLDVDGSGRMVLGAWAGAGYKGDPKKGYVVRVVPEGFRYEPFEDVATLKAPELVAMLRSESAVARFAASQEIVRQADERYAPLVLAIAQDAAAELYSRVAAIFTLKQLLGSAANPKLVELANDASLREFALRAATDRRSQLEGLTTAPFVAALESGTPRQQAAAAVALGRLGDRSAAPALLAAASKAPERQKVTVDAPEIAFDSGVIRGSETVEFDVDIGHYDDTYLIAEATEDGNGDDHVAWFEPTIVAPDGSETPLLEWRSKKSGKPNWEAAESGWGKVGANTDCTGAPLKDADGNAVAHGIGSHADSIIHYNTMSKASRLQGRVGFTPGSKGKGSARFLIASAAPGSDGKAEGPHATPNSPLLIPHLAVQALVALGADSECVDAVGGDNTAGALWALKNLHTETAVEGLLKKMASLIPGQRDAAYETLLRLAQKEAPYAGDWWWGTRPDTRGPYYKPEDWEMTATIEDFIRSTYDSADTATQNLIAYHATKNRSGFEGIEIAAETTVDDGPTVDLKAIASKKGGVGEMSIEDVIIGVGEVKGDAKLGEKLFTQQGCVACHTLTSDEPPKGPYMGQIGGIMNREQIAESILKPNASISQGFASWQVTKNDGSLVMGFITAETTESVTLRDIVGQVHQIETSEIKSRAELHVSMMPPGLANALSLEELASLLAFLETKK